MSRYLTPLRLAAAVVLLLLAATRPARAQGDYSDNTSYQEFYDELSPYGEWIDDPQYGYVWVPDAGDDFRPYYSNGYWTNTDYGNTWVSNYNWGWAPFHYGRWTYNNYYGWVWIPGNVWGPAWVSWRAGGGCYGWAPLGPGISVSLSFGSGYYVPDYWWTFTPQQYILNPRFHQHCYGPRYNNNYIRQTTIINNTYVYNHNTYITGPRRNELERATGRPVPVVAIRNNTRPDRAQLRGNTLDIYRPAIAESRPRSTERPRRFQAAEQPITAAPREIDRDAIRRPTPDRSQTTQSDRTPQIMDRQVRPGNNGMILRQPGTDRVQVERAPVQQSQPARSVEMQQQPRQQRTERAPINRMESPRMQQAQPSPQQRMERPMMDRQQPVQQQRVESPRMQQAQPVPQQRIERQAPVQQQRMESPRMESPRAMPQREAPAAEPQRSERPRMGDGDGGRPSRR